MSTWRSWWKAPGGRLTAGEPESGADVEFRWIDITDPDGGDLRRLVDEFSFDDVAVEDAADEDLYPRYEDFGHYLVVALRALSIHDDEVETTPVLCFLTRDGLVTVHHRSLPGVDHVADAAVRRSRAAEGGPDRMLARLADAVIRRYEPLVDEIEALLETLEDEALEARTGVVQGLTPLRRQLADLRSVVRPQRLAIQSMVRTPTDLVSDRAMRRLTDVVDRLVRLLEDIEAARLMATAVVDLHRGAVAERTNDAMRVLTVFSATLLPMTVVAGIYGMNLDDLPLADLGGEGAEWVLAIMGGIGVSSWAYFARRGFVARSRIGAAAVRSTSRLVGAATQPLRGIGAVAGSIVPDRVRPRRRKPPS